MRDVAKWIGIGWSIFCLIGVVFGMANVGQKMGQYSNEYENAGYTIGMGCGMAMWVGIWAAIAAPAFLIYLTGGGRDIAVSVDAQTHATLCKECGRYYEGTAKFCPHCGKPTS